MGASLIQVPALCRLRHPVHLTLYAGGSGTSCPRSSSASRARNPEPYSLLATRDAGTDLPCVGGDLSFPDVGEIYTTKRIVVIGIHGWFTGTIMRTLLGEPTRISPTFASMMKEAIEMSLRAKGIRQECTTEEQGGEQGGDQGGDQGVKIGLRGRASLRDGSGSAYHTTKAG